METTFAPEPANVRLARRFVADALPQGTDATDVAILLASELVTNVVLHARTKVALRVQRRGRTVRVEVADDSPLVPQQRDYGREATTGRGLGLVEALASRWGTEPSPRGKVVWFELDMDAGVNVRGLPDGS